MVKFRDGRGDVQWNCDAASAPYTVHGSYVIKAGRDKESDAFFFEICLTV